MSKGSQPGQHYGVVDLDEDDRDDAWNERDYPPPYSATTVAHEEENTEIGFQRAYLFSVNGALRCIEIVLSLIGFVAVLAGGWTGSGFVGWTCISAFVTTTVLFFLVAFNVNSRVPGTWIVYELIYCIIYTLEFFISTIIAGAGASVAPSIVTACAICAVTFFIFLLDGIMTYKQLKALRAEQQRRRAAGEGGANRRENNFCIIF